MDRENFESKLRAKFEGKGSIPSEHVWKGIASTLNENAAIDLTSKQNRYKWVAVAAVFLAVFSFALNIDLEKSATEAQQQAVYNALLPSSEDHFRFFEPAPDVEQPVYSEYLWSKVLFVDKEGTASQINKTDRTRSLETPPTLEESDKLTKIDPTIHEIELQMEIEPYYVAQYRTLGSNREKKTTFWAGVEAGAGNFNPEISGNESIAANVNFDALANNLGQNEFNDPSSSTTQTGMTEGTLTSFGLDFGLKMGRKWTLESGVQYASISNQSSALVNVSSVSSVISSSPGLETSDGKRPVNVSAPSRIEVTEDFDQSLDLENTFSFTSIPVKAGYFIVDDKVSLRLNAGVSANYLLFNRLDDPSGQIETSNGSDQYNKWSFDGLTGLEFGINVFDNFNFTIEPNYRQSITPLGENLDSRSGFMFQTGLRYRIE